MKHDYQSLAYQFENALCRSSLRSRGRRKTGQSHAAAVEVMESRQLLTVLNCLAQIEGTVFKDLADNGLTGDDARIAGASAHLYQDGGDRCLSSSDGLAAGDDTFLFMHVSNAVTDENQFVDLAAGSYFVEQESAVAGYLHSSGADIAFVTIPVADAIRVPDIMIDDFFDPIVAHGGEHAGLWYEPSMPRD